MNWHDIEGLPESLRFKDFDTHHKMAIQALQDNMNRKIQDYNKVKHCSNKRLIDAHRSEVMKAIQYVDSSLTR